MAWQHAFSRFSRSPHARIASVAFAGRGAGSAQLLLLAFVLGCQPGIGDDCESSADCSASGDRLCDITQPGGYCTIFNCEPDTCPEDAVCVLFSANSSTVPGCEQPYGTSPYQRSFCMKTCEEDGDCRNHYSCIDVDAPGNPWGAVVVDGGENGRICVVPYSASPPPDDRSGDVCSGAQGEFEYPPDGGTSPGGAGSGGEAGEAGAGGASGAQAGGAGGA